MKRLAFVLLLLGGLSVMLFVLVLPAPKSRPTAAPPLLAPRQPAQTATNSAVSNPVLSRPLPAIISSVAAAPTHDLSEPAVMFSNWVERHYAGDASATMAQGVALAWKRREAMRELIETDPEKALKLAVPFAWRSKLPLAITRYFEERVDARGDFILIMAEDFALGKLTTIREVVIGETRYEAFVYGRRVKQKTQANLPLHGIALEGKLALHEDPIRPLTSDEAAALERERGRSAATLCGVCGQSIDGAAPSMVAELGGETARFCGTEHLRMVVERWIEAEGGGGGGNDLAPGGAGLWTRGPKDLLYMRVNFPDDLTEPLSETSAYDIMDSVNEYFVLSSYDNIWVTATVTPLLTLPGTKSFYTTAGPGALFSDARSVAFKAGYDTANYELDVVAHTTVPGFDWGGLGVVGGKGTWLQSYGAGVTSHELGHNMGLLHAHFWNTTNYSSIGPGTNVEYGNVFDTMGAAAAGNNHFGSAYKQQLDWLPDSAIHNIVTNGIYRIYAFDASERTDGRAYAAHVRRDFSQNYWMEFRHLFTGNPWLQHGVLINREHGDADMIDTTPGTPPERLDSAVVVGRTYTDPAMGVHITTLRRDATGTDPFLEVQVNVGEFPSNQPPEIKVEVDRTNASPGQLIHFHATASDPDGDALVYSWFGTTWANDDPEIFSTNNLPWTFRSWPGAGERVLRCVVSDMKGGVASANVVARVGAATGDRISGVVLDEFGEPVEGVRVDNGVTNLNDNYIAGFTDSNGRYVIVGVNGEFNLEAYKPGFTFTNHTWTNPITAGPATAQGIDFVAIAIPQVTLEPTTNAVSEAGGEWTVTLTRTGSTSNELVLGLNLSGSATRGADYSLTPTLTAGSNSVTIPAGSNSLTFTFAANNDVATEVNETVTMTIFEDPAETFYVPRRGEVTVTILDNDSPGLPQVSVARLANAVSENGTDSAVFVFTRTGGTNSSLAVNYSVGGTATAGTDFPTPLGLVIIPVGSTRATVALPPIDDKDVESDESIALNLLPNATYSIGVGSASVVLLDDDLLTVTIAPTASGLGEPNGSGIFTVKRDGDLTPNVVVYYSVSGTASNGVDFETPAGVVTIPAGETSADIFLMANDDALIEGDETVTLTLTTNPGYNIGTPGRATMVLRDNEKVPVSIVAGDSDASEPGENFGQISISRGGGTSGDLAVYLSISGTAIPGADYVPLDNPVVIPSGASSVALDIIPFDDLHIETNETVRVQIAPNSNYVFLSSSPAEVTITDNDDFNVPAVGFALASSSAPENESPGIAVSLSYTSASPVTVNYRVIGGTASPADYTLAPGILSFEPGELTKLISLPIVEDNTNEPNETLRITLYDPLGATHDAYKIHTYTIVDNDGGGSLSIAPTANGSEVGPTPASFRITRTGNTNASVVVNFQITGTATAPGDYASISNSITVPAGVMTVDLPIVPLADGTVELDETVVVTLTSAPGAKIISPNKATVIIADGTANNLPVVTVTSTNTPYAIENGGQGAFVFARSGSTTGALTLYLTFAGTAINGVDCAPVTNVVTIPIGQASVTVNVTAINDVLIEGEETLIAALTQRDTYRIGYPADTTVTIQDNDQNVRVDGSDFESAEPGADLGEFTFTRFGTTNTPLTVFYSISGTASNGVDYAVITNSFVIPAGKLAAGLPIQPLDDPLVEGHETVVLTLLGNSNYSLATPTTGTVTILDDEPLLSIVATETNVVEGSRDPGRFTVIRGGNPDYSFTARLSVAGTATFGVDYPAFLTNVYFPCGVTGMDLLISPTNELIVEPSETVNVRLLADPAYTILAPTNAIVTILDAGTNRNPRVTITSPTVATVFLLGTNVNMILEATVADDSDTNSPLTLMWTNTAGPVPMQFGNLDQTNSTASFTNDGVYVLRLIADDGQLTDYGEVTVVVDTLTRLSTNLLHWALDDGGGAVAMDASGNNRSGAIVGTPSWTTSGARAGALGLNGSGSSVRAVTNASFLNDLKQFSLGLWVKASVTNSDLGILSANEGSTNATFALYSRKTADCGNASNVFTAVLPASRGVIRHVSASNATSNNWVHLALTWSNNLAPTMFINGSRDQPLAHFATLSRFLTNCTQFILGQSPLHTPNAWNGFFDDVRVFPRALHPAEALALSATNLAPLVDVPTNITVQILTPVPLPGLVSDDGQPVPPGALSLMWTQASGPVSITLTNPTTLTNYVEFITPGEYVFRLIADDGQVKIYDDLIVTVTEPTQVNVFATDGDAAELGPDPGEFMFLRVGDTNFDLTIQIAISGIASNGADFPFIPITNTVTFPAGVESLTAPLIPFLDHRTEGDETFTYSIVSNVAYSIGGGQATVVIHDSPYGMWNIAHFTLEELTDPTLIGEEVDFDHDGLVNFAEYAVNRDPKAGETNSPLVAVIEADPGTGSNHITITFTRRIEPTDTSYEIVVSNDLLTWNAGPAHVEEISATDDGNALTETVKARLVAPWPNGTNQFVTVRVWLRATGP
jgi:hypothetical protein